MNLAPEPPDHLIEIIFRSSGQALVSRQGSPLGCSFHRSPTAREFKDVFSKALVHPSPCIISVICTNSTIY